jgi:ABC-2 type transport system ATP-binding protein
MMVGLIAPNKGSISIVGHDIHKEREKALDAVGAVVENPELYAYLSGRENLMQIARIRNIPRADVEDIIELVGLKDRIGDKVKKYSLGMKQRLGLAAALMPKPKLLILDEPTNGLDPTGILDFRNIVKKAARERNTAVFVSSHILSEVQQLCDTVAFINNGTIQAVESINGNVAAKGTETIEIVTEDNKATINILKGLASVEGVSENNDGLLLKILENTTPEIIFALAEKKVRIKEVYKRQQGLEERYIELVEGGKRNG